MLFYIFKERLKLKLNRCNTLVNHYTHYSCLLIRMNNSTELLKRLIFNKSYDAVPTIFYTVRGV